MQHTDYTHLMRVRELLAHCDVPLETLNADLARERIRAANKQLDDYILPRAGSLDAPLTVVVGGSTGAGKSTLVNSLLGEPLTRAGAIRPTTRQPVLLHRSEDAPYLGSEHYLPSMRHHSVAAGETVPGADAHTEADVLVTLQTQTVPPGIALIDAPDIDSVSEQNRRLAKDLLSAAERDKIAEWAPLTVAGRAADEPIAATWAPEGTDVDFGALTKSMVDYLQTHGVEVRYGYQVTDVSRESDGSWTIQAKNRINKEEPLTVHTKFVFLGAGGGALHLLQKSGIEEGKGYGGFPVSGLFLRSTNEATASQHNAKVYGQASVGAPPMSVPHLDTRYVDGKRSLLFGPYAGFKPNFLKQGSYFDLPLSVRLNNVYPMTRAGAANTSLVKYLVTELFKSREARLGALHRYYPEAVGDDWELITAGQRVQIMKRDAKKGGVLQFGTEVVSASDGSLAALLGASPGASTAAPIMLNLLNRCFPSRMAAWEPRIRELVPGYGMKLNDNPSLADELMGYTAKVLGIYN